MMVMLGPHHINKAYERDLIEFHSKYSLCHLKELIENSFYHEHKGFQIDCFEYKDPIAEWIEQYYITSSIDNNMF